MADFLEDAEAVTNLLLEQALNRKEAVPEKTGFCLSCDEPTDGAFCSTECRDDYERIAKLNAINGKK